MRYAIAFSLAAVLAVISLAGCGVSQADHEKIVKELDLVNQEKATLNEALEATQKENASANQQIAQLQNQNLFLAKENQDLKTRLTSGSSPMKRQVKPAHTSPVKP